MRAEDLDYLRRVDELGAAGTTQQVAARRLGRGLGSMRYRVNQLGFEFRVGFRLADSRTGRPLAEMLAAGDLPVTDGAPAEAAA